MFTEPILIAESAATDEERARLGLFPGEMVYRIDRVRGHGEHLLVEDIRLPAALFPSLQCPVPNITGLADIYCLQLGEAVEKVCALPASEDIAKVLGVAEGTLVLTLDRVVHLRDGLPAEWRMAHCLDQGKLAKLKARLGL